MDSRDVALAHTAGISCPQQAAMALFALFNLMYQDTYKPFIRELLHTRIHNLYREFGKITFEDKGRDTYYYALIDILELAEKTYERELAIYMMKNFYPVDFVHCLAIDTASVCLPGYGFFEPEKTLAKEITPADRNNWSIRVSLANLDTGDYPTLGKNIMAVLKKYQRDFSGKPIT
jgi:aspartate 4-decarboxylase